MFNKGKVFDYSKNEKMIFELISRVEMNKNDIILDFFSGSATTAHAVMQLNAEDDGNRKFIMVQIPEATDEKSEAYKAGYKNICEIGKERIRRAGKKILEEMKGQDLSASSRGQESVISTETKGSGEISKQDPSTSLEMTQEEKSLDIGFRVYKVDSSNIKDVYFHPN
ncbi:Type III restriction-modification system methylation subunit, partial [Candidatus Vampirococcus lugosii]|nr:Type III restriction-modification system methylation subunit [Candidatus Vampirococcus lugosii]